MKIQTFIFTPSQAIEINKDLESLDDRNDQMNYSIFRNNQERYKKLTGLTLSSHEAITEAELEYFEEMNKEPEDDIKSDRCLTLTQLFIRTLQDNHVAA